MRWNRSYFHLALALLMLITGSINTLSVKYADKLSAENTIGENVPFNHPFLQACGMFLGEMMCMVAFYVVRFYKKKRREQRAAISSGIEDDEQRLADQEESEEAEPTPYNPLIFWPAALCDMTATSIQYIALTLTYASSFQMLRGAVIIFTGILSTFVLRRRLGMHRWIGIVFVIIGLCIVGLCDILFKPDPPSPTPPPNSTFLANQSIYETNDIHENIHEFYGVMKPTLFGNDSDHSGNEQLIGDVLIVCAQIIVASQMVYEEKVVSKYNVPALQAVGWEGTFGFLTLATLLIPFYFIPAGKFGHNPRHVLEDAYDGLFQLTHNWRLGLAFCGTVFSIAFFNFAGISVTKEMSATTRMVLDSVRTLVIWTVSLAIGWQTFQALQLLGFVVLVTGMCVYNDIVIAPLGRRLFEMCQTRYNRLEEPGSEPPPSSYGEINADA